MLFVLIYEYVWALSIYHYLFRAYERSLTTVLSTLTLVGSSELSILHSERVMFACDDFSAMKTRWLRLWSLVFDIKIPAVIGQWGCGHRLGYKSGRHSRFTKRFASPIRGKKKKQILKYLSFTLHPLCNGKRKRDRRRESFAPFYLQSFHYSHYVCRCRGTFACSLAQLKWSTLLLWFNLCALQQNICTSSLGRTTERTQYAHRSQSTTNVYGRVASWCSFVAVQWQSNGISMRWKLMCTRSAHLRRSRTDTEPMASRFYSSSFPPCSSLLPFLFRAAWCLGFRCYFAACTRQK